MNRKIAAAMLAAAITGGGVATAVSPPLASFAAEASSTTSSTVTTPGQWIKDTLKGLVDKGTINQEQSDAVAQTLEQARPQGNRPHGNGRMGSPVSFAKAAEVLGVSKDDIRSAFQSGKSLADLAKEKNIDVQKVIDAVVAQENSDIDRAVSDGKLTQDQANVRKADVVKRVTALVNGEKPLGAPGGMREGGPGHHGDMDGDDEDGSGVTKSSVNSSTAPASA